MCITRELLADQLSLVTVNSVTRLTWVDTLREVIAIFRSWLYLMLILLQMKICCECHVRNSVWSCVSFSPYASFRYSLSRSSFCLMNYTARFIRFSMITNIYNKKTKGPPLMKLFTTTGKLKKKVFFFPPTISDDRCVHHGWHGTHRYDIEVLATHASAWVHRYFSLLQWSGL